MALPTLNKLANNFHNIECNGVIVWFSYKTIIAFAVDGVLHCRKNEWGPTTGKHLNTIEPDHKRRMNSVNFDKAWEKHVIEGTVVNTDTVRV